MFNCRQSNQTEFIFFRIINKRIFGLRNLKIEIVQKTLEDYQQEEQSKVSNRKNSNVEKRSILKISITKRNM